MIRHALALAALAVGLALAPGRALTGEARIETDANLITALDVSDSIMRHDEWIEFEGVTRAVASREFLSAIDGGRVGRIGFAIVVWAGGQIHRTIVPWRVIAGPGDVAQVLLELDRAGDALRFAHRMDDRRRASGAAPAGLTDLSAALDLATAMAASAPYAAARTVINICGNGVDNVGAPPGAARNRALAAGFVVNGLVLGAKPRVVEHYRRHVQGGAGSFVLAVEEPDAVARAFLDKFLRDLIAAPDAPRPPLA